MTDRSKSNSAFLDAKIGLKEMKIRSLDKPIFGHVNINSIRNKFDSLMYMLDKKVDIFRISETKLDDMVYSLLSYLKSISPPGIRMTETIEKVSFHGILGRTFHQVYCNVNHNAI